MHPVDPDTGVAGMSNGSLQRHPGDLESGHGPAAPREPDGVRALTTADIQHPSRGQVGHLDHQRAVGPATPEPLAPRIARVPLRPDRRVTDIAVNSGLLAECGRTHREVIGHGTIVAQQFVGLIPQLPAG